MTGTIINHTISFGGHSSSMRNCQYCSGTVSNCLCDLFKRINDGRLQYNAALEESVLKIINQRGTRGQSQNKTSIIINQEFQTGSSSCASSTTAVNSPDILGGDVECVTDVTQKTSEIKEILTEPVCVPDQEEVTNSETRTVLGGGEEKVQEQPKSKGWCEKVLGDYCPIWLRRIKVIDYDGEEYRRLQTTLAVAKHVEQDGKFIQKLVYRPDDKHVRWYLRPFNIQQDYSYSAICEMVSNSRKPRKPYHSGIQEAPRKHLIRRWLNWRWEWEAIIDFIYEDFGYIQGDGNVDLLEGVHRSELPPKIVRGYSAEKPGIKSYANPEQPGDIIDDSTEDYGRFNSRGSSLIEEVFGGLIAICKGEHTQLVSTVKNHRRYASV